MLTSIVYRPVNLASHSVNFTEILQILKCHRGYIVVY